MFEGLKSTYYNTKDWFRNCCNKNHFKTVWKTFRARPWEYSETYDVLKYRLIETREYFKKTDIITKESANKIVKEVDLALSLYDIISGEKSAGHFEYCWDPYVDEYKEPLVYTSSLDRLKYIPERYVNLRNADRFARNEVIKEYYKKCPNELYEDKAKKLFWRVIEQYSQNWWD